ncbi:hypothetical protein DL240_18410 [Lujinxingia litoralis]|uniref:Methyl-accepting chemotaxis protein n=1 Tax=Lujinxingia litoralis TaxID=2211119 RepID=A0A328C319_9DELT|nr:HAMP domain-containing methyl-accepting chemotaxis protein [Lujinxingia litoralis]RAL20191.1 hypothetical protein DL240_18410 [Lujinxingia litoralis]
MSSWKKIAAVIGLATLFGAIAALVQGANLSALLIGAGGLAAILYTRSVLNPYGEVIDAIERLAQGDLTQPRLTVTLGGEIGRMATAVNQLLTQLRMLSEEATELANGYIGVRQLQSKVLETGQLSAVDLPSSSSQGDLNRSFAQLTNQLRRLTVKAYIIANDQLFNPALDEELPGELGDAFGMMVRNLRNLAGRAGEIARGDLTSQVEGDGDLTNVFNEMVTGLREVVEEIMRSALHVATSTEEMLQVLHQHENSAQHQAAKIRQTQLTVEGLFNSSDAIADSARQVSRAAEDTCQKNRQIGAHIQELNQHSERISEILKLIKDIADRSDLLALNASLEGARAGEAGKGFALVANEMRRLAENTMESVGAIKSLVGDIQDSARTTAVACQEGLDRSEETTEVATKIKVVTQDQRENTGEVNRAMEDLSRLVTNSVAGIRQVTVTASELATLSESLREMVERFDVGERHGVEPWQLQQRDSALDIHPAHGA